MSVEQPVRRYPEMRGKIVLVTGGTSGIGLAAAQAFVREGASVVLASRDETRAQAALQTFPDGAPVSWTPCDTASGRSVASLMEAIQARHGRLDYAFNNGGSSGGGGPIATMSEDTWRQAIDGYLTSVFLCMRQQIPAMLAGGGGVIVNNSSVDGLRGYPFPGGGAYAAAKHGVLGLTKSAALEHASSGLRITAICPGWVATPPVTGWIDRDPKVETDIVRQTPRGRIGTPEEIANAVLWLCSDAASFMIGSPIVVDGGYMA